MIVLSSDHEYNFQKLQNKLPLIYQMDVSKQKGIEITYK